MERILIADVVPVRSLPPQLEFFSYQIPATLIKKIKVGSVVQIFFKNQRTLGIVEKIAPQVSEIKNLKSIDGLTDIVLTAAQLEIALHLSRLYYQSRAVIYKTFLTTPPLSKRAVKTLERVSAVNHAKKKISRILRDGYVFYKDYDEILSYISALCGEKKSGQTLIIAPERKQQQMILTALQGAGLASQALIVPLKQTKNDFYRVWKASSKIRVLIGSTNALFFPFSQLSNIIIFEAENLIFKKAEQSPRYHLADFVYWIADLYKARLLITGFSPDISLLQYQLSKKRPIVRLSAKQAEYSIIDMKQERTGGSRGYISMQLADAIQEAHGAALLIFNRLNNAASLACRQCGHHMTCPVCKQPLRFNQIEQTLLCVNCTTVTAAPLMCPECHTNSLQLRSSGMTAVMRELRELFPQKTIIEFSSESKNLTSLTTADIIVATNKIFSYAELSYSLAAYINTDQDLNLPNVYAAEMMRHYVLRLGSFAPRVYLQTFNPNNYFFATLTDVHAFYENEVASRRVLNYPPFTTIIKVKIVDTDEKSYKNKLGVVKNKLVDISHYGPFENRQKNKFIGSFILKIATAENNKIDAFLKDSYNLFTLEVNPYDFLS